MSNSQAFLTIEYKKYINDCFDIIHNTEYNNSSPLYTDHNILTDKMFNLITKTEKDIFLDNICCTNDLSEKSEKISNNYVHIPSINQNKIDQYEKSEFDIWNLVTDIKKEIKSDNFDDMLSDSNSFNQPLNTNKKKNNIHTIVLSEKSDNTEVKHDICLECKAVNSMIEDERHCCIVCSNCGCQKEELLENGPEWHQYNNDDGRGEGVNRCGSATSYYFPKSSQGTIITGFNYSRLTKKQKWNGTVYKENTLNKEFEIITQVCLKNKISKIIIDTTKFFYKQITDCKHKSGKNKGKQVIIRGGNRDSVIGACIYKACETNHDPISKKEIAAMISIDEKRLSRGIKEFERIMKNCDENILETIHDGTPEDYINKFSPSLQLDKFHTEIGLKVANNCAKLKLATDHGAQSIGAGIIYMITKYYELDIEKKDIVYWFKTSDVTITKIYNKISPFAKALVDDEITDHIIKKFKING
jgi:transcription initiation factor TFIIB